MLLGRRLTVKLLEDALDRTGASAAAHGDVELVCVRHVVLWCGWCLGWRLESRKW
jgi:hypothetical protein